MKMKKNQKKAGAREQERGVARKARAEEKEGSLRG